MKKIILTSVLSLALLVAFGLEAKAEMPKEGTFTAKMVVSSTSTKAIAVGDRLIFAYEYMGVCHNDKGEGFLHNASVRGLGSLHAWNTKGVFEYDRSSGVLVDSDGDQVIFTHEVAGKFDAVRTLTFHGGTGKYTGIQGGGNWTWNEVRSAAEGSFQGYMIMKGHWKLP
jgi:hypothetical protein